MGTLDSLNLVKLWLSVSVPDALDGCCPCTGIFRVNDKERAQSHTAQRFSKMPVLADEHRTPSWQSLQTCQTKPFRIQWHQHKIHLIIHNRFRSSQLSTQPLTFRWFAGMPKSTKRLAISSCFPWDAPTNPGGGLLPYMGYIGTCRGIGYGFWGSRSLNRVSFFTLLFLCP